MVARFKKGCNVCEPSDYQIDVCDEGGSFGVTIIWDGPCEDLDTSVKYETKTSGYDCDTETDPAPHNPAFVDIDDQGAGGVEYHYVKMTKPETGEDDDVAEIYTHWHTDVGGLGCPIIVIVNRDVVGDPQQTLNYAQGSVTTLAQGCSASVGLKIAEIRLKDDNTWELARTHP